MTRSAQLQIGSKRWLRATCDEGNCQGPMYLKIKELRPPEYGAIAEEDILMYVLKKACGPDCAKSGNVKEK